VKDFFLRALREQLANSNRKVTIHVTPAVIAFEGADHLLSNPLPSRGGSIGKSEGLSALSAEQVTSSGEHPKDFMETSV